MSTDATTVEEAADEIMEVGVSYMIRDITIGQYYPAKSVLHRLDPRVKLLVTLLFLISLFLFRTFLGYLVDDSYFWDSHYKAVKSAISLYHARGMKPIMILLLFTLCDLTFPYEGRRRAVSMRGFLQITEDGLCVQQS